MELRKEIYRDDFDNFEPNEAQIEEYGGKRRLCFVFPENSFHEYEKRMLTDSGCPYTLPVRFLGEDGKLKAYYDFTGFLSLEGFIRRQISLDARDGGIQELLYNSLEILNKILMAFKGLEDYLLQPRRMRLNIDAIFIRHDNSQVAFSFIPEKKQIFNLQDRILCIVEEIKTQYSQPLTDQYFDKFVGLVHEKNLGLDGMISVLGMIQRDVSYVYWNSKDFRKAEYQGNQVEIQSNNIEEAQNPKGNRLKVPTHALLKEYKLILLQAAVIIFLIVIYFTKSLDLISFSGVAVVSIAIDLLVARKLYNK